MLSISCSFFHPTRPLRELQIRCSSNPYRSAFSIKSFASRRVLAEHSYCQFVLRNLHNSVKALSKTNEETVIRIVFPHSLMDRYAFGYELCKSLSPFKKPVSSNKLRIALHVRRGELLFVNSERLIDLSYYLRIARSLSVTLTEAGIPFEIELHSEVLEKDARVEHDDPAFKGRISDTIHLQAEQDPFLEFEILPNLRKFINEPAITCIERLATSDILIMSISSFSYLAAVLNPACVVFYHPFSLLPLDDWIIPNSEGEFDAKHFSRQLQQLCQLQNTKLFDRS